MKTQLAVLGELTSLLRGVRKGGLADSVAARAFELSPNPTVLADAITLRITGSNEAFRAASGFTEAELCACSLPELLDHPADDVGFIHRLRNPQPNIALRTRQRRKDQDSIDVELTGYSAGDDRSALLAYIVQDVTFRNRIETRLREKHGQLDRMAHNDALTGLPNRLSLAAHLPDAIEQARRNGQLLAVLFLDLDRFKQINDTRGHEVGDRLLQVVAQRLREATRNSDMVVRMGGDEFIVVLQDIVNSEQVMLAATRIIESLSRPFDIHGKSLVTTVSIGASLFPRDGNDMGELLRHSDTAMYQAKDRGRNNYQVFSPLMDRRLKQRTTIEAHLREALLARQLDVFYQPIVDLNSQRVVAMESLLRWKHPKYGYVAPAHFIGIAEETGLIVPIGEFVLDTVLKDAVRWRQDGASLVPISINVSAIQLQRANLPALITQRTHELGMHPSLLQIELTESAIFERREGRNGELNQDAVAHLRDLGVHVALDDFGTGYSSLSYLKRWRFDSLKIDRSFVRDVVTDPSDLAIVGAITAMARHLNVPVTAEGIEGWQQLGKLRELGCQQAQGYLFSRPVPADQCPPFLAGTPLELLGWSRNRAALETTGVYPVFNEELLELKA